LGVFRISIPLQKLDLNLLPLLLHVYDTASVSEAGARMGLSQPASSNALNRLRAALGDSLFLRGKDGMVPTAFAEQIVPEVRDFLAGIETTLSRTSLFDPATSTQTFRLSLSGLGEATFLPPLATRLLSMAPGVRLENISAPRDNLPMALSRREADVAIGIVDFNDRAINQELLFHDSYVAIAGNVQAQGMTKENLAKSRIVLIAPSATYAQDIMDVLDQLKLTNNVAIRLRHFGGLPELLNALDMVAIVPGQYGHKLQTEGTARILPFDLRLGPQGVKLVWHKKTNDDPACIWLREQIRALFKEAW